MTFFSGYCSAKWGKTSSIQLPKNKGQKLFTQTTWEDSVLEKGSDHSGDDMQGLGHVRENTQPVALLSSLSVTPYNPPFKEMSSFMVPSTQSKSTPLRSLQLKHTTKPHEPISDVLFTQSVHPSIPLIVCLSFSEKKPTCVSTLSWHGSQSPAAQASGSHKAHHLKLLRSAGYVAFGG